MFLKNQYKNNNNNYYSSSSEQSCDTVIYVGPNGKRYINDESSDNEIWKNRDKKQINNKFNLRKKILNEVWIDGPKGEKKLEDYICMSKWKYIHIFPTKSAF